MAFKIESYGWCCTDCLMMLANGENESWTEQETQAWNETVENRLGSWNVDLGGEHEEGCPNVAEDGSWIGSEDCDCERIEFSRSPCDVCGSWLGGSRDAVFFYTTEESNGP